MLKFPLRRGLVAVAGLLLLGAACIPSQAPVEGSPRASLADLRTIEDMQARFNQDAGAARLILLLSPT